MDDQDKRDIESCLCGDKNAYGALVRRYQARISRLMWRFCREPRTCEELVQEVFVQGYLSLKDYRGDAPFEHWLSRVATFIGYRYWKKQAAERAHLPAEPDEIAAPPSKDDSDLSKVGDMLHALLARLNPEERLVLTLLYFEECSIKEIARRMKWTVSKTKVRAFRARNKLRDIAEEQNFLERIGWTR
ncbi:MAG TPA: RNA polymerase sigma factor [Anaerohalosphaeraceae bacterium]|nr:RNA polymerase sigma factor [Anaerohalosphaeraceae bacterium]HRT49091.1 RNA polymerase sigma factor [Anaerohalosphaeraceae bacterium]HRT85656.1 RNA polymerase sigma factor [Anaerohalosphaeraceae bacterium]